MEGYGFESHAQWSSYISFESCVQTPSDELYERTYSKAQIKLDISDAEGSHMMRRNSTATIKELLEQNSVMTGWDLNQTDLLTRLDSPSHDVLTLPLHRSPQPVSYPPTGTV